MNKIAIIIQREYLSRVRKKSFILLTFLTPILFGMLIFGTIMLSDIKDNSVKNIVVFDETGKYFSVLQDRENYHFIEGGNGMDVSKEKQSEDTYATLLITKDLLIDPSAITLFSNSQVISADKQVIIQQLDEFLREEKLNSYNIPNLKEIIADSKISVNLQTIKWDEAGNEKVSSAEVATIVGMLFTLIIYMFIFVYGGMVMQGVLEEKTNRIVEVMVSSVKPFQLMMGKIIGIGLVGLTQFFLWAILILIINLAVGVALIAPNMTPDAISAGLDVSAPSPELSEIQEIFSLLSTINVFEILSFFVIFFIGGYMIYASLFAAIGSMVNSQEDSQQFMLPVTILILFAFYAGFYSINNPNGPLAFWTSMIPFTSPIVMMTRLPFDVPLWEKLLSIVLLFSTVKSGIKSE